LTDFTSPRAARLSAARRLSKRSFRAQDRAFLAEGPQAISEAVNAQGVLREVFYTSAVAAKLPDLLEAVRASGAQMHTVAETVLDSLAQTITPQGIIGVCSFIDVPLEQSLTTKSKLVSILANVRDPGNAGTVIRCSDAAGADAVIVAGESVDPYNAKAVRASAGSLFHLPLSVGVSVAQAIAQAKQAGLQVFAADGGGSATLDQRQIVSAMAQPTAWVFGNEAWGLPEDILQLCDEVVAVPIYGQAESLNLGTAAAVCLYASAREQRS